MSNLALRNIEFNTETKHPVYQRGSDGFFCLSQACLDLGKSVSSFLKSPAVGILFMRYGRKKAEKPKMSISSLVKNYPHLIYYDRSSRKIESGVWLHQLFLPAFEQWAQEIKGKNWQQHSVEIEKFNRIYQVPTSHYQFWRNSLVENTSDIWLRESDGFVRADSLKNISHQKFDKLFKDKSFITNLEILREKLDLDLDYSILNEQSISYSERVYRLYQPLYDRQIIEGSTVIWMHPELAQMFDKSLETSEAIDDWQQRTKSRSKVCHITQVGSPETKERQENELSIFRVPRCDVSLYDAPGLVAFKITEAQSQWQFLLCLVNFEIIISFGLLCRWGLKEVGKEKHIERPYRCGYYSAQAEIERGKKADKTIERLLKADDIVSLKHFDLDLWSNKTIGTVKFGFEGAKYVATMPGDVAKAIEYSLKTARDNFIYTGTLKHTRVQLAEMGYDSPLLLKQPKAKSIESDLIASFEFKGHTISYRLSDGFVDANSLCKLRGKNLTKWLKNDQTWELFEQRAKQLGKKSICPKKVNSESTRVSASFPYLIERKRGSKANGGGTWLDADLSIQLLAWIDAEFALELGRIFKERIQNKNQPVLM